VLLPCTIMINNMKSKRKGARQNQDRVMWFGNVLTSTDILVLLSMLEKI
jgi:hypothetical protein